MASSKDFVANQIRSAKLILTGTQSGDGGIGVRNIGLAVYDESVALNDEGIANDSKLYDNAGTDVAIIVSGSTKSRGTNATSGGVVLFGGDTFVSGTLVVENTGRTYASISGSIHHTSEGKSYLVAAGGLTITSASNGQVTIDGSGLGGGGTSLAYYDESSASPGTSPQALGSQSVVIGDGASIGSGIGRYGLVAGGLNNKVIAAGEFTAPNPLIVSAGKESRIINSHFGNIVGGSNNLITPVPGSFCTNVMLVGSHLTASDNYQTVIGYGKTFNNYNKSYVIASGSYLKSDGINGGAITGSITRTKEGVSYLVAGTNMTITSQSNGQIVFDSAGGGGGSQNLFQTIAVAGQSDVVADGTADTLTLTAAGGMTITTDAGSDTITFNSADYAKATSTQLGLVELFDNAVQSVAANSVTSTASRTYGVQLNSSDQMVVNVPWSDTNTQLTNEQVQDIVGAMFTGNTETNITATYQDSDGTIDLVASAGGTNSVTKAWSYDGPHQWVRDDFIFNPGDPPHHAHNQVRVNAAKVSSDAWGMAKGLIANSNSNNAGTYNTPGFGIRLEVPPGMSKTSNVTFTMYYTMDTAPADGNTIQIRLCGRLMQQGVDAATARKNDSSGTGKWRSPNTSSGNSSHSPNGFSFFITDTTNAGMIVFSGASANSMLVQQSQTFTLGDLVNSADINNITGGSVIDILFLRNSAQSVSDEIPSPQRANCSHLMQVISMVAELS